MRRGALVVLVALARWLRRRQRGITSLVVAEVAALERRGDRQRWPASRYGSSCAPAATASRSLPERIDVEVVAALLAATVAAGLAAAALAAPSIRRRWLVGVS